VLERGALVSVMWDARQEWRPGVDRPSAMFASPNWLEGQDNHLLELFLPSIPKWVPENADRATTPYLLAPDAAPVQLRFSLLATRSGDVLSALDHWYARYGIPSLPAKPRSYETELAISPGPNEVGFDLLQAVRSLPNDLYPIIAGQRPDGSWAYEDTADALKLLRGATDYKDSLGVTGDTTIGTCTFLNGRTRALLRYARITGSPQAREAGLKALRRLDRFVRPEGAQTWEVPLHTPDILASANAIQAYLEGYYLTGNPHWLERARYWGRTGLPFIYVWSAADQPIMKFASTPVFGASVYVALWFGVPVQWTGLEYAYALLQLAKVDDTFPWRHWAEGIIICGMQEQRVTGPHAGTFPDSVNVMTGVLNPTWIDASFVKREVQALLGNDASDFETRALPHSPVRVSAEGRLIWAAYSRGRVQVEVKPRRGEFVHVVVAGIEAPTEVRVNGRRVPAASGQGEGWDYDHRQGVVVIRAKTAALVKVAVAAAPLKATPKFFTPAAVASWEFDSDDDAEGWSPTNDLAAFVVSGGRLRTRSIGPDPFSEGPLIAASADKYRRLVIRMKVSRATDGQVFWTRQDDPGFSESKSMRFALNRPGEMAEYVVPVGDSAEWRGTISRLRLDPGADEPVEIEIEAIRLGP